MHFVCASVSSVSWIRLMSHGWVRENKEMPGSSPPEARAVA